ncbi:hypothetical protein [Salinimicrobium terrae]|uniref:hypothetical protein n=1 Tax=Salinimicrobium terrae TaxID=470866 RepID=UPI0003FF507A|nr:hypothetical protein [Salinimicrobium terrae]
MRNIKTLLEVLVMILFIGFFFTSCNQNNRQQETEDQVLQMQTETEVIPEKTYRGQISSLNESANQDRNASGNVILEVQGDQLLITVEASGLEPNMMHLQHLHGSKDGKDMNCPDPAADTNGDGLVDITEAYNVAGVTMIPFHNNPPNMEVDTQTYPTADENGNISYQQTVDLNELRGSFNEKFNLDQLDFSQFTYLIHGVQENSVPKTVQSVKGLPAHVTLPIGCAELSEE